MPQPSQSSAPPVDLGIVSTVLGSIGLILFFLPILAIPIATCGALSALVGFVHALRGGASNLRWAVVGLGVSLMAIAIGLWLAYAPIGLAWAAQIEPAVSAAEPKEITNSIGMEFR